GRPRQRARGARRPGHHARAGALPCSRGRVAVVLRARPRRLQDRADRQQREVTPARGAAKRQIVFLRGINLGSRNRISMAELRELLSELGYEDVRTHLQSGNVVLASTASPAKLRREIESAVSKRFGLDVDVVVRTRAELAAVVKRDPLGDVATNRSRYLVNFLSAKPSAASVRELSEAEVSPEQFVVSGKELYAWHP